MEPGAPLPGLRLPELDSFRVGKAIFDRPFSTEEGLGPLFNQDRCSSCHDLPTSGGHGAEPVSKATRFDADSGCNLLSDQGGPLLQQLPTRPAQAAGVRAERAPPTANAVATVFPTPLYGLGLVAAIPATAILENADPADTDGDGISGRPALDGSGRLGRFGRKAQHADLGDFVREAIRLEMGITTPDHPEEDKPSGLPLPANSDPAPDPEMSEADLRFLEAYVRFLAPVRETSASEALSSPSEIAEGERIFEFLGCHTCHVPSFPTGPSASPALRNKRFLLYSDLLLHDMGPELADICTPTATPSEWKTARLSGLRYRSNFLHDGRAQTLEMAILLHGGEADAARDVFRRLTADARRQLIAFLRSL